MIDIKTSPSLDNSTKQLQLLIGICTRLNGRNDLFSLSIRQAIRDNRPTRLILETVKSAIEDNRIMIESILGHQLTEKILLI